MEISIPKEAESDFRLFIVTHGGSIDKCYEKSDESKMKGKLC